MCKIIDNLNQLQQKIRAALHANGRENNAVELLAVSKRQPAEAIRSANQGGQQHFGENYLQEALSKQEQLSDLDLIWHFIGPIQSNKTRPIADHFDWVHSVDRLKIAQRLSEQREPSHGPLNICLQVNINDEPSKAGVTIAAAIDLATAVASLPNLRLRGLMAIPEANTDPQQQRSNFEQLVQLQRDINATVNLPEPMDTLSMGMSQDMEAAIAAGSTIVRIGTALFGARPS